MSGIDLNPDRNARSVLVLLRGLAWLVVAVGLVHLAAFKTASGPGFNRHPWAGITNFEVGVSWIFLAWIYLVAAVVAPLTSVWLWLRR